MLVGLSREDPGWFIVCLPAVLSLANSVRIMSRLNVYGELHTRGGPIGNTLLDALQDIRNDE